MGLCVTLMFPLLDVVVPVLLVELNVILSLWYAVTTTDGNGCRVECCGKLCNPGYWTGVSVACVMAEYRSCCGTLYSMSPVPLSENRVCLVGEASVSTVSPSKVSDWEAG